jgi:DNA polymerase-3 subunit epsilon
VNLDGGVVTFDLETTGTDVEADRIVTAYIGLLDRHGRVVAGRNFTVKPDGYIVPDEAAAIHGVTTEVALAEGLDGGFVVQEIAEFIMEWCRDKGFPLVGHNLSYDLTLFDREIQRYHPTRSVEKLLRGVTVLDTLVIDKHRDPYRKGKRTLIVTAEHYGVELSEEEAHGAQADAIASGRIMLAINAQDSALRHHSGNTLQGLQAKWKGEQAASLQNYFRTKADPLQPDAIVNGEWPYQKRFDPQTEGWMG